MHVMYGDIEGLAEITAAGDLVLRRDAATDACVVELARVLRHAVAFPSGMREHFTENPEALRGYNKGSDDETNGALPEEVRQWLQHRNA